MIVQISYLRREYVEPVKFLFQVLLALFFYGRSVNTDELQETHLIHKFSGISSDSLLKSDIGADFYEPAFEHEVMMLYELIQFKMQLFLRSISALNLLTNN